MIFPLIETENIVQVGDKTRLSAVKSFKTIDEAAITKVEIQPDVSEDWYDVTGLPANPKNWYLDWSYGTAGDKVAAVRITTDATPEINSKTIVCISEADDKLWSDDNDLALLEPDILNWVKAGRASYKDYHRAVQKRILEWFDNKKIWNIDGEPFTKDDIDLVIAQNDLKRISTYWVLELIFGGLSNKPDDTFRQKEISYRAMRKELQGDRSRIRADYNKDTETKANETYNLTTIRISR